MGRDWTLTNQDYENAEKIRTQELITPINKETMFLAGVYVILAAAENHEKHVKVYNLLLDAGFNTLEKILDNQEKVKETVKTTRFQNQKPERIINFSHYWKKSDISEIILEDIANGRKKEFEIRNIMSDPKKSNPYKAPGMLWKSASFFLLKCGYENVVPIDVWMLRYLKDMGCKNIKLPNYRTESGPSWVAEYERYEKKFHRLAKNHPVSPGTLQAALWQKYSTWNKINKE